VQCCGGGAAQAPCQLPIEGAAAGRGRGPLISDQDQSRGGPCLAAATLYNLQASHTTACRPAHPTPQRRRRCRLLPASSISCASLASRRVIKPSSVPLGAPHSCSFKLGGSAVCWERAGSSANESDRSSDAADCCCTGSRGARRSQRSRGPRFITVASCWQRYTAGQRGKTLWTQLRSMRRAKHPSWWVAAGSSSASCARCAAVAADQAAARSKHANATLIHCSHCS